METKFKHDTGLSGLWQVVEFYDFEETVVKKELNFEVDVLFRKLTPIDSIDALKRESQKRALVEEDFNSTTDYKLLTRDLPTALTWSTGTVLYDDIVIAQIANKKHKLIRNKKVDIDIPEKLSFIDRYQKNEDGQFILPQSRYLPDHYKKLSKGVLYQLQSNGIHYVIPCTAIFKAYYNTSRGMYQSILSEHIFESRTKIIDGTKSTFHNGIAHVQLRSHLTNNDAKFAARYFLGNNSPRAVSVLEVCRIRSKLIYERGSSRLQLFSAPPFVGETEWSINYFEIENENGEITRFITDILSCSFEWGFNLCTYRRDNPGIKSSSNEEPRTQEKGDKKPNNPRKSNPPTSEGSSSIPKNNHLAFQIFAQNVCTFNNAPHSLELEYPTKEDPKYVGIVVPFSPERGKGNNAEGDSNSKTGRVHPETNRAEFNRKLILGELLILEILATIFDDDLKVNQITVSDKTHKHDGRKFDFLPLPKNSNLKGAKLPAFLYADEGKSQIRLVSTVRINVGENYLYYIDIEKRLNTRIGCIYIRSLNEVREELSNERIYHILKKIADNGGIALKSQKPEIEGNQKYTIVENLAYHKKNHTTFSSNPKKAYIAMLNKLNECGLDVSKQLAFLKLFDTIQPNDLLLLRDQYKKFRTS